MLWPFIEDVPQHEHESDDEEDDDDDDDEVTQSFKMIVARRISQIFVYNFLRKVKVKNQSVWLTCVT